MLAIGTQTSYIWYAASSQTVPGFLITVAYSDPRKRSFLRVAGAVQVIQNCLLELVDVSDQTTARTKLTGQRQRGEIDWKTGVPCFVSSCGVKIMLVI